jgi:hypothetical protein
MTTPRYDLHTIDYSVQGWDVIMATDMEKIDDMMPTRIIGMLGETVTAHQPLYLKAADSKWYKAQANGAKQPCQGLAVEGGDASDEIRIHRMGEVVNAAWAWASIGAPIYLDPATAGILTQVKPGANAQIVGYALAATKVVIMIQPVFGDDHPEYIKHTLAVDANDFLVASGVGVFIKKNLAEVQAIIGVGGIEIISRGGTVISPTGAINVIVWRAPYACTVTNVRGYRVGGTGATINARLNGVSDHLAAALSLTSADTWMDGGAVQNTAYVAGDKLEIMVVTVAGTPTQVAVQIDFTV